MDLVGMSTRLEVVDRNTRTGDDGLNHTLAVFAFASLGSLESGDGLFEGVAVSDKGLQVNLAGRNEGNRELVVTRLIVQT
jgi:hypothetical protein